MKKLTALIVIAACMLQMSCSRFEEVGTNGGAEIIITATCQVPTKTVLNEETKDIYWNPNDQVSIFFNGTNNRFTSQNSDLAASATFAGQLTSVGVFSEGFTFSSPLVGLYPYSETASCNGTVVSTTLSDRQDAVAGTFADDTYITMAQSTNTTMGFYAVCGGVRFRLVNEGVKQVVFEPCGGEMIAGSFKVAFENGLPSVQEVTSGKSRITLSAPAGESFVPGEWYYIVALPAELASGFRMTIVRDADYAVKTFDRSVTVKRSVFGSVDAVDQGLSFSPREHTDSDIISFADPFVKERCVLMYDLDGDGELSYGEAAAVQSLNGLFNEVIEQKSFYYDSSTGVARESISYSRGQCLAGDITSFDELQYFTGLKSVSRYALSNARNMRSIILPANVTSIEPSSFSSNIALESVVFPEDLTLIGMSAFSGCSSLKHIGLPESLKTIGDYAFSNSPIDTVIIPQGVETVGSNAFYYNKSGSESFPKFVSIPSSIKEWGSSVFQLYTNEYDEEGNRIALTVGGAGTFCDMIITGTGVTDDGLYLINSEGQLCAVFTDVHYSSFSIPDGVRSLGTQPYGYGLSSVYFSSLVIPDSFDDPKSLVPVQTERYEGKYAALNGMALIDGNVLYRVSYLCESIEIPSYITEIGNYAFRYSPIRSIVIPSSVSKINESAFYDCRNLTSVVLPEGIKTIPRNCFSSCYKLADVVIPSSVERFEKYAFLNCYALLSRFRVPANVRVLEVGSLASDRFSIIEFESADPPTLEESRSVTGAENDTYNDNNAHYYSSYPFDVTKTFVYVPDQAYERYKHASVFNKLRNLGSLSSLYGTPEIQVSESDGRLVLTLEGKGEYAFRKVVNGSFKRTDPRDRVTQYTVTLTKDYYIAETECPQWLWEAVMHFNPASATANNNYGTVVGPNWPVCNISLYDCMSFISELNKITGLSFRLPTEAEWEFAAKGGNSSKGYAFSGTNDLYYMASIDGQLTNCARYSPNELGLYDMHGNVEELCADAYYNWQYGFPVPYGNDPFQEETANPYAAEGKVTRGGSYSHGSYYGNGGYNRLTDGFIGVYPNRNSISITSSSPTVGFRLAL